MTVYNISYDLNKPGQDYTPLIDAIQSAFPVWCHPVESTWLIDTKASPDHIYQLVARHIDVNDTVLITPVGPGWISHGLSPAVVGWLRAKL